MRWEVKGVDARTGDDRTTIYEAPDEAHAAAQANYNGVMVESVKRIDVGVPVPERMLDYRTKAATAAPKAKANPAAQRRAFERACLTRMERIMYSAGAGLGFFLMSVGLLAWIAPIIVAMMGHDIEEIPSARFITDNAIGASANAAEVSNAVLKYRLSQIHWDAVLLIGLMFLILSAFIRHRGTVRAGTMSA